MSFATREEAEAMLKDLLGNREWLVGVPTQGSDEQGEFKLGP